MTTRANGTRHLASGSTKPDRQLDKRSLDQPSEPLQKAYAKIDEQQKSLEQRLQTMSEDNKQNLKDVMAELAADLNDKLELQAERIQHLERDYEQVLEDYTAMQERVKQLEERLESSQTCSMSAAESDRPERRLPSQAAPSGQWEQVLSRVSRLTDCKMQDQDLADQEARKKKEVNAVLRNFGQEEDETPDCLKEKVDAMLSEKLETTVACVSAKRLQKGRSDAAQGIVIVQFEKKQHKITVFKARGKLAGTTIGLDDDLTILQQQRKNATWPAFKDFRSRGVKTQWRAEKLFVKEGEHFVEHKVLNL